MTETLKPPHHQPLFETLHPETQIFLSRAGETYRFSFQEFRELVVMSRDLEMWRETPLRIWHDEAVLKMKPDWPASEKKKKLLSFLRSRYESLKSDPKKYTRNPESPKREALRITVQESDKKIHGDCPVASSETVCCNLKTIDAVENCAFGCSYCTIQTFYGDQAVFDNRLAEKLAAIPIDPARHYHYGTGQSSDSLVWGNRNGNLDTLLDWAESHPNVLLEFKTKSDNVAYFLERNRSRDSKPLPRNIVLSWSLNPQIVIDHEEHFTAPLERRITAARQAADAGIKVSFHFHPMIFFEGWKEEYPALAAKVQSLFNPREILFISMGSVTFIKPVMQAIRKRGEATRIMQMQLVKAPNQKFTYPADLKIEMFQTLYQAFRGWHSKVFFYLCMEEAKFWDPVFGSHFATNELFEKTLLDACFNKIA